MQSDTATLPNAERPRWTYWLLGALTATALMALLSHFCGISYATNDDTNIMRAFMTVGTPPTFHLYLHPLLCYPLAWLSAAVPLVPWFSWMQLAFLWFGCTVIVKNICARFAACGISLWLGALAGAVLLSGFCLLYCARVTYTQTAALLSAAAAAQALCVDYEHSTDGQIIRRLMLSLVLIVLAYAMRQITALPALAFWGLACLWKGLERKKARLSWKPILLSALAVAVVLGGLAGLRELEIRWKNKEEYLRWHRARISVMDYTGLEDLSDELLEQIGWTSAEPSLVGKWFFMDQSVSTDAFESIEVYQRQRKGVGLSEMLQSGLTRLKTFTQEEPLAARSLWLMAGVWALCMLGLILRRDGALYRLFTLLLLALLAFAALYYLACQGRLPLRAATMVLLPTAAFLFCMLPDCLGMSNGKLKTAALGLAACGCIALCIWTAIPTMQSLLKPEIDEHEEITDAFAALDEYALSSPDTLIIYDDTLVADMRMFPDTANGLPTNLLFWGGWGFRSPECEAKLNAFGLSCDTLDASFLLSPNVELARGIVTPGPDELRAYLCERFGEEIDYSLYSEGGGVSTFTFQ